MSNGTPVPKIDGVDATARALYRRAKTSGAEFADVATVVRRLHTVLKHLKVEAEDPDSLLNSETSSVYARQLTPIIEDCDFTLKQLDTILEKYGESTKLEERERDMVAMIRTKLANQKTNIDMFLDTVQLHNPTKAQRVVDSSNGNLDGIKDKVDAIAARLFQRRDSGFHDDEEELWEQFKTELAKEGFSEEVLRKNKDILRAYIREVESTGMQDSGAPPSVRGLLEQEKAHSGPPELAIVPASYNHREDMSPKEMHPSFDNEKFSPAMKLERRMPEQHPAGMPNQTSRLSYEKYSSDDDAESDTSSSLALISTRDLMEMDGLNRRMGGMHLSPIPLPHYSISPSSSPSMRYLPSNVAAPLPSSGMELSASPNSQSLSLSPRFVPPLPPYSASSPNGIPPPPYGTSPQRQFSRLAPDRYGMDIPLEAKWTRIKRALVSPQILERAGVRYEARPDYVAVLGVLTREEIAEFARLSQEARASRSRSEKPPSKEYAPKQGESGSSHDDSDDVLWDESDTTDDGYDEEKGTKAYYIVPPPSEKDKGTSPAATVKPKPILKNRNENHVKFDANGPHEVDPDELGKSPRTSRDADRDGERRRRRRDRDRDGDHHRDKDHARDRDRHRDGDRDRDHRHRRHHSTRDRSDRDRSERDRDRGDRDRKDERSTKKKAWGETLGAVGIGGAAASLLSVLSEAASAL